MNSSRRPAFEPDKPDKTTDFNTATQTMLQRCEVQKVGAAGNEVRTMRGVDQACQCKDAVATRRMPILVAGNFMLGGEERDSAQSSCHNWEAAAMLRRAQKTEGISTQTVQHSTGLIADQYTSHIAIGGRQKQKQKPKPKQKQKQSSGGNVNVEEIMNRAEHGRQIANIAMAERQCRANGENHSSFSRMDLIYFIGQGERCKGGEEEREMRRQGEQGEVGYGGLQTAVRLWYGNPYIRPSNWSRLSCPSSPPLFLVSKIQPAMLLIPSSSHSHCSTHLQARLICVSILIHAPASAHPPHLTTFHQTKSSLLSSPLTLLRIVRPTTPATTHNTKASGQGRIGQENGMVWNGLVWSVLLLCGLALDVDNPRPGSVRTYVHALYDDHSGVLWPMQEKSAANPSCL
ncbi:unnamed protein product [Diplocarpon coronariae]|nr:hypothetical protein JHW43_009015 [Diplocarpon mali]